MSTRRPHGCLAIGAIFAAAGAQAQGQTGALEKNPFDRPAFVMNLREVATAAQAAPPVLLDLRTTMVGEDAALANINGEIVSVGQTYAGYRVASIREGRVVLTRDGERVVLDLYATQRGENDARD